MLSSSPWLFFRVDDLPSKWSEGLVAVGPRGLRSHDRRPLLRRRPGAALDLLQDRLELNLGADVVPALRVGAEDQPVARPVRVEPRAVGDRLAVLPRPLRDLAGVGPRHQSPRSSRDVRFRTHRGHLPVSRRRACPRRPGFFVVRSPRPAPRETACAPASLVARPGDRSAAAPLDHRRDASRRGPWRARIRSRARHSAPRRAPSGRGAGRPRGLAAPGAARHGARRALRSPRCPRGRASSVSSGVSLCGYSYGRPSPAATPFRPRVIALAAGV